MRPTAACPLLNDPHNFSLRFIRPWRVLSDTMGVGSKLQELGRFLDDCERRADPVESLNVMEVTGVGDRRLTADLELRLSLESLRVEAASLCSPRVGPDGTVRFALAPATGLPISTDHDVSVTPTDVDIGAEAVTVTLAAVVPANADEAEPKSGDQTALSEAATGAGAPIDGESEDRVEAGEDARPVDASNSGRRAQTGEPAGAETGAVETNASDDGGDKDATSRSATRGVPPFKDPDLLATVYESCNTFAEMAEKIDMDVTGETVRRYMIQHDIHEPTPYQTGEEETSTQPVALADGIGLPDDVTVETLIETVTRSNTITQVKRDIDIEREDALEMLRELNLLDLVVGRLATENEREITRDNVIECLREASAVESASQP